MPIIPNLLRTGADIKVRTFIEDCPVYEVIEVIRLGAGYDPVYHRDKIEIRDRKGIRRARFSGSRERAADEFVTPRMEPDD